MIPRFPHTRLRRNRTDAAIRRLVCETRLSRADLIWPLFVHPGADEEAIATLPGVMRLPVASLAAVAQEAIRLGIGAVALFPYTPAEHKDPLGKESLNPDNLVCRAVRALRAESAGALNLICDVALDPYTTHGHDGILDADGIIDNDRTLQQLCAQAQVLAEAGADTLAPSDMMDGRIAAIRARLEQQGHYHVRLLSYAAKYASCFYGPFRDAIGSSGTLQGDKRSYQMDPGNAREAVREVQMDAAEGADIVMVKPALPYLDIITRVRGAVEMPVFAYQVSGEYAMVMAAARQGAFREEAAMMEALLAIKRAGADAIISYFAPRAAALLG